MLVLLALLQVSPIGDGGRGIIQSGGVAELAAGADTFRITNVDGKALLFQVDGKTLGLVQADSLLRNTGRCDPPVAKFGKLEVVYVIGVEDGAIALGINYDYHGCANHTAQENFSISTMAVAQMRFLYQHLRVEFAGCLYGHIANDTAYLDFFVNSASDPRLASDSMVPQGACPRIKGETFLGLAHSHIRTNPRALCVPSSNDQDVLYRWRSHGARVGFIMCAGGDSLALFSPGALGVMATPSLDSLYQN